VSTSRTTGKGPEIERAEPFWLDDGGAEPVLVEVEHLYLADALAPTILTPSGLGLSVEATEILPSDARAEFFSLGLHSALTGWKEILLRPGDDVELTGWLSSEVDPYREHLRAPRPHPPRAARPAARSADRAAPPPVVTAATALKKWVDQLFLDAVLESLTKTKGV
jgi:hypothetical protein